jgi:hypothetical protein
VEWNRSYPYLVWISTLLLGPMFYFIFLPVNEAADFSSVFQITFYFFFFGFLLSAPAFLTYLFLFKYLLRDNLPLLATKALLSLTAIATLIFTIYIIGGGNFNKGTYKFILAYSVPIVFSSFLFKIKKSQQSS